MIAFIDGLTADLSKQSPLLEAAKSSMEAPQSTLSPAARRVLVVEDSEICARLCQISLVQAGHAVVIEGGVKGALDALGKHNFDAMVCDLFLPDGHGTEVGRTARTQSGSMLMIAVSAMASPEVEEEALEAGFDMFLLKPLHPRLLVELLAQRERER